MTPEKISKLQKIEDKKKKLHEKYKNEKLQNYENNDVRNETLKHIIETEQELYQQQKEQISKQNRVLTKCKKILKYETIA